MAAGALLFILIMPQGSLWLVKKVLLSASDASSVSIRAFQGSLLTGVRIEDMHIIGIRTLGSDSSVMITDAQIKIVWNGNIPSIVAETGIIEYGLGGSSQKARIESLKIDSSTRLTAKNIQVVSAFGNISLEQASGPLDRLVLENLQWTGIPYFASRDSVSVQRIIISKPFHLEDIISIDNGVLRTTGSEPILFYGVQDAGNINLEVFSKNTEVSNLISAVKGKPAGMMVSLRDVNVHVTGSLTALQIKGHFKINLLAYRRFFLEDVIIEPLNLTLKNVFSKPELFGDIGIGGGGIRHKDTYLEMKPGKILFQGDYETPHFELEASSKIANATITVRARGTPVKPELVLSSSPVYPEEKILIMLATGKEWTGSERAISEGRLSVDAVKEFIDYFVFGGAGDKLAQRFGVKQWSVYKEESAAGIELKKTAGNNVDLIYGVEKKSVNVDHGAVTQKIGFDYKATENTSLVVEGSAQSKKKVADELDSESKALDKSVTMKVKTNF